MPNLAVIVVSSVGTGAPKVENLVKIVKFGVKEYMYRP